MKSKSAKLSILLTFIVVFIGSALFMYFKYIHNKPKIKIVAPRTELDPRAVDSVLNERGKDKK